jgi:hypothetical protein
MPYVSPGYWEAGYAVDDAAPAACGGSRLVLAYVDGTEITLHPRRVSCAAYPWLVKTGNLLLAARAGHLDGVSVGESANMDFEIDNEGKQASELLGYALRSRGTFYDDNEDRIIVGLVQQIQFGQPLVLTLEA